MTQTLQKYIPGIAFTAALLIVPFLTFGGQIVGFSAALSGGTYQVGTDSVNGVNTVVVSSTNVQVTLAPGQYVTFTNTSGLEVTLSSTSGLTLSSDCSSGTYFGKISVASGGSQTTFTVTPSATTCTSGSGSTTSIAPSATSAGSSGGGGPAVSIVLPPSTTAVTTTTPAPEKTPALPTTAAPAAVSAVSAVFSSDLTLGSRGADVTRLQQLLASDPSVYPEGLVTGYYGVLTAKAVRAFQAKYGIAQVGRVGPQTRAKLSEIFSAGQTPSAVPTPATPTAAGLTRELDQGATGNDVRALQEFLAKDKSVYPERLVTGYYGVLTAKAVRAFQAKYGISQVGRVGPQTLERLNAVMGGASAAPSSTTAPAIETPSSTQTGTQTQTAAPASANMLTPDPATQQPFKACTPNC